MSKEVDLRAVKDSDQWATCDHRGAGPDMHSCPKCNGTLRRCCDTLVGYYEHAEACPEQARRRGEQVA